MQTTLDKRWLRLLNSLLSCLLLVVANLLPLPAFADAPTSQSVFTTQQPQFPNATDRVPYELGMKVRANTAGQITGVRYYKAVSDTTTTHIGKIWALGGSTPLATVTFSGESASGWQQQSLATPLTIQANTTYIVSVNSTAFPITYNALGTSIVNGNLSSVADGANGVLGNAGTLPTGSYLNSNYFRDIVFTASGGSGGAGVPSTLAKQSGDAQTGTVATALTQPLVVKVIDSLNNPVAGTTVNFQVSVGGGTLSASQVTTAVDGTASTILTLGTVVGTSSVTATVSGLTPITFSATRAAGASSKLAMSPATGTVALGSAASYQVQVQDQYGNLVSTATSVSFTSSLAGSFSPSSTLTTAGGTASVSFTSSASGTGSVTASSSGITQASSQLTVTGSTPQAATLSKSGGDNQTGAVGTVLSQPLTVVVRDGQGSPYPGATVVFAVATGGGSLSTTSVASGTDGTASTTLTLSTAVGTSSVTATVSGLTPITFSATRAAGASSKLAMSPANGTVALGSAIPYQVQIQDQYGNLVSTATSVSFTSSLAGSFSPSSTLTTAGGTASVSFTSSASGTGSVTASSSGITQASSQLTVTGSTPQAATLSKSGGDNQTGAVGTVLSQPLTVVVRDGQGSPYPGATVVFAVATGGGSLSTSQVTTAVDGTASTILTLGTAVGTSSVTATVSGLTPVTFSATRAAGASSKLAMSPANGTVALGSAIPYQVQIQDQYGNLVSTATSVSFTSSLAGSFSPSSTVTTVGGTASMSFTSSASGTGTVTASSSGITQASSQLTVTGNQQGGSNQSVFTTQQPQFPSATDKVPYELGMKVRANTAGQITAVRYYKSTGDTTTTHIGKIWALGGSTPLATVTFSGESASGWQQQSLATPLTIQANTTYIVSVNSTAFPITYNALGTSIVNGNLSSVADGANGVLGNAGTLPTGSYLNSNYFRDIVFTASGGSGGAGVPSTLAKQSGDAQTGTVGTALVQPLVVKVTDSLNNPVAGTTVNFQVSVGGGTLSTSQVNTAVDGIASTTLTLGTAVGTSTVTATVNGLASASFTATSIAGASNKLALSPANGTVALGSAIPYQVQVQDQYGNLVSTATSVSFTSSLAGSFSPSSTLTTAGGTASVNFTSLTSGTGTVTASSSGLAAALASLNVVTGGNATYLENQKQGTANWKITNQSGGTIAGYAGSLSVNKGQALPLKVSFDIFGGAINQVLGQYKIEIYRLGSYGGTGGRLITTLGPLDGIRQPDCLITDPNQTNRLVECKWATSVTLQTGTDWVSGLYVAKLIDLRTNPQPQSQIWFVVRDDGRNSDVLFQSSFNTFAAYNTFGGYQGSFNLYRGYDGTSATRAYKVSFDRPFSQTISNNQLDSMLGQELLYAQWLESQGYDVTYVTNMDVSLNSLLPHKAFLSVGHDEYWTMEERQAVQQARDAGINLGFFAGNAAYWRVRYESSTSGEANRVLVCYKTDYALDPTYVQNPGAATTRFRDPPINMPENALLGVMYIGDNDSSSYPLVVSNSSDPLFANTNVTNGYNFYYPIIGWEWDGVVDNGFTPSGLQILTASSATATTIAPGQPGTPPATQISNSVRYKAASNAEVFASGTIRWGNGLTDLRFQQFNINILSRLGASPYAPSAGLIVP
jgi:Domain of unknown function (DUF4082)/Invasin, domain 3